MKRVSHKDENFTFYITNEFDGNHILHMDSSKRGKLDVWWGRTDPTSEQIKDLYDRLRG